MCHGLGVEVGGQPCGVSSSSPTFSWFLWSKRMSSGLYSKCIHTLSHLTGAVLKVLFSMPTNATSEKHRGCFAFSFMSVCPPILSGCHVGVCPSCCLDAEITYTSKSSVRGEGWIRLTVLEESILVGKTREPACRKDLIAEAGGWLVTLHLLSRNRKWTGSGAWL